MREKIQTTVNTDDITFLVLMQQFNVFRFRFNFLKTPGNVSDSLRAAVINTVLINHKYAAAAFLLDDQQVKGQTQVNIHSNCGHKLNIRVNWIF